MAVVRSWSGAGLSPGALTTSSAGTGDTPFTSITGNGLTVDSSGPRAPQIRVPDGTGAVYGTWTVGPHPAYALRFYVTKPTHAAILLQVDDSTGNKSAAFDCNSTGNLRLTTRAGGTNVNSWIAAAAFPVDTRTRVEYTETSAGVWTLDYFLGDSTTPIESGTGTKVAVQNAATIRVGRISGAVATTNTFLDDVAVGDTAAPLGPWADGAVTPSWFRFNGSTWAPAEMHRL